MTDNVLLHLGEEPRFDAIQTADIKPALQTAIAEARTQIAEVKAQTHTDWANTVERLTGITERVGGFGASCPISTPSSTRPNCAPSITN